MYAKKYNATSQTWQPTGKIWTTKSSDLILPATINSNGTAITAYTIKGNTVQDGTPTPSSPVAVEEFGKAFVNLCPNSFGHIGVVDDSGNTGTYDTRLFSALCAVKPNTTYSTVIVGASSSDEPLLYNRVIEYDSNQTFIRRISQGITNQASITFTTGATTYYVILDIRTQILQTNLDSSDVDSLILNEGDNALPYIPYGETRYDIPITSGGVTEHIILSEPLRKIVDYADTIDSDGVVTRRIKKLVLTGQESWEHYGSSVFWTKIEDSNTIVSENGLCNSYVYNPVSTSIPSSLSDGEFGLAVSNGQLYIKNTAYSYASDFKSYLVQQYTNGTPVTIWYVLATPETSSQAGVSIPTVAGDNTISVDTTVQPSEFTATWTGWHELVGKVFDGTDWI